VGPKTKKLIDEIKKVYKPTKSIAATKKRVTKLEYTKSQTFRDYLIAV